MGGLPDMSTDGPQAQGEMVDKSGTPLVHMFVILYSCI